MLEDRTLEFARRIAALPTMTALMIKESVNQTVDNQGFFKATYKVIGNDSFQAVYKPKGQKKQVKSAKVKVKATR